MREQTTVADLSRRPNAFKEVQQIFADELPSIYFVATRDDRDDAARAQSHGGAAGAASSVERRHARGGAVVIAGHRPTVSRRAGTAAVVRGTTRRPDPTPREAPAAFRRNVFNVSAGPSTLLQRHSCPGPDRARAYSRPRPRLAGGVGADDEGDREPVGRGAAVQRAARRPVRRARAAARRDRRRRDAGDVDLTPASGARRTDGARCAAANACGHGDPARDGPRRRRPCRRAAQCMAAVTSAFEPSLRDQSTGSDYLCDCRSRPVSRGARRLCDSGLARHPCRSDHGYGWSRTIGPTEAITRIGSGAVSCQGTMVEVVSLIRSGHAPAARAPSEPRLPSSPDRAR